MRHTFALWWLVGMTLTTLLNLSALAESAGVATVQPVNGAPAFVIDGLPNNGLSFMSYVGPLGMDGGEPALAKYAKEFSGANCELYTFVTDVGGVYGYSNTVWPAPERWDFSHIDTSAHMILGAAGANAKLILQLYIDAPAWWVDAHQSELMLLSNGTTDFGSKLFALPRQKDFPSIASTVWRADMKHAVEQIIEHVEQSDYASRVVGYQVCGLKTEEWYHWSMNTEELGDYSAPMANAFRAWLRDRYASDVKLREAWHSESVTIDTAAIPSKQERYGNREKTLRAPETEMAAIDFHRFWSDIMADTIAYFAKAVKDKTQRRKVVGAFYAYSFEFADLVEDAGHLGLQRLLQSPDLDFIMGPDSYYRRALKGGQSLYRAPVLSLNHHGKMLWTDFDPASFKFYQKDQKALAPWKDQLAVTDTPEEFTQMVRRDLGNALANGVNMAYFDLHGGYYDDPVILGAVRASAALRTEALKHDRSSCAQILVVFDEDSQHFVSFRNLNAQRYLVQQVAELPFVAPFDAVLLSDLDAIDTSRYKLVLMVNAFRLDGVQRGVIDRKLKRDAKHIVWLYAPGYFTGDGVPGSVDGIASAIGMTVASRPKAVGIQAKFLADYPSAYLLNGDQFVVTDPGATVLAKRADGGEETVIAQKALEGWTSVYSAAAPLPRQCLRTLAVAAGVHLYHDNPEDAVYANNSYVTLISGVTAGPRTIHLPRAGKVVDTGTGAVVAESGREVTIGFGASEARIFAIELAEHGQTRTNTD